MVLNAHKRKYLKRKAGPDIATTQSKATPDRATAQVAETSRKGSQLFVSKKAHFELAQCLRMPQKCGWNLKKEGNYL